MGSVAAAVSGSAAGVKVAVTSAPGKCQPRGDVTGHAMSTVVVVTPAAGDPTVTPANGAAAAAGVTATDRAPPLVQAYLRRAATLIHSPCQLPWPSGSMSHTLPRERSYRSM